MRYLRILVIYFICGDALYAQKIDYQAYTELLKVHVTESGKVDYKQLQKNSKTLNQIVDYFALQNVSALKTKNEKLSYWLNVYNINTLKLIIAHYPIKSILDTYQGKPWDTFIVTAGDKSYTLNQIENELIRPVFKDPRIHFALNCGAKSCPRLLNKPYTPEHLDAVLDMQTKEFIRTTVKLNSNGKYLVSKIFEWYKADFGEIFYFINKYSDKPLSGRKELIFDEYSWDLNQ